MGATTIGGTVATTAIVLRRLQRPGRNRYLGKQRTTRAALKCAPLARRRSVVAILGMGRTWIETATESDANESMAPPGSA